MEVTRREECILCHVWSSIATTDHYGMRWLLFICFRDLCICPRMWSCLVSLCCPGGDLFLFLSLQCRYTLQYTYPYAYYMESGPRKKLVRLVCL